MDRPLSYPGALARVEDLLLMGQKTMIAIGGLARAVMGTGTWVEGFTCVPTAPASLAVSLTPGQVFQVENLEASAVSVLSQDTHSIMKQGSMLDATSVTLTPPTTPGYAVAVLIEVQYADLDSDSLLLNYYNPADPTTPLEGPGGNGQQQPTTRKGIVSIQTKYGAPATSGTQVMPTPDAGWAPLFVVTLGYGQTSITVGNIVQHASAPYFASQLGNLAAYTLSQIQKYAPIVTPSPILYVRPDGSDTIRQGIGINNTSASAFQTIAAAINYGTTAYYFPGGQLTIQLGAPGTYVAPNLITTGAGAIVIQGDPGNPAGYIVAGAGPAIGSSGVLGALGCTLYLQGFTLQNTGTTNNSLVSANNGIIYPSNMIFTNTATGNAAASVTASSGGAIVMGPGITFSGSCTFLANIIGGTITMQNDITLSGTPNYSGGTVVVTSGGRFQRSATNPNFIGSGATGALRYNAFLNGTIQTNGGGANFIPGNVAGATSSGGQYA